MLNSHAVKAIKNRRSIIFHDTMYAKDASIAEAKEILMKKFGYTEQAIKNLAKDSDPRGYKVKDQIIKGFMIYKSGKPNTFTAKNESGEQYEGTMEEIKAKIDAYWAKRDEDVMKQKDGGPGSGIKGHTTAGKESEKSFQKRHAGFMENIISSHFPEKNKKDQHQKQGEVKQKVNDAIKIVSYKGYEIIKNDNDNKFRVFLSGFEVFVPQKSLEAAKALIDKKNSKAKVNDHGYVVNRMGDYHIIEGAGVDGGWWFAKEVRGKGKLETKKFKTRAQAEEHARMSQPNRDEDVMKQKDGLTSEDKRQIQESIRRLESKRKEAIKAGKENYLNSEIARLKKALEEPTDFFMRDISDSKTKDDIFYQGQQYPAKELHRILANKGKVKEFNELSEKEQKERMGNPFALYESGDNIYAVVRRNKAN